MEQNDSYAFNSSFKYQNPLKVLNYYISYTYQPETTNLLYERSIFREGSLLLSSFQANNKKNRHLINSRLSKNFHSIGLNSVLGISFSRSNTFQVLNNFKSLISNQNFRANLDFEKDFGNIINLQVNLLWQKTTLLIKKAITNDLSNIFLRTNASFFPKDKHAIELSYEVWQNYDATTYHFWDCMYRVSVRKTDIEFSFQNILNQKNIENFMTDANTFTENSVPLRRSQVLFSVKRTF